MSVTEESTAVYNAGTLAKAWLSVAFASGSDPDIPILNRTVFIERFASGLRLVATDRYLLLTAFVPTIQHEDEDGPDEYVVPDETAIAIDLDGRARGLLGYLLRQTRKAEKDGNPPILVSLALNVTDDADTPTLAGLESRYVRIEYEAQERVQLEVYGGEYPDWRSMVIGFEAQQTASIALNPDILGRLARAGKLLDNAPVSWEFGGSRRPASVLLSAITPRVSGVLMPMNFGGEPDA